MFFRNGIFGDCLVICDVLRAMTLSFHRGFPSLTKVNSLPRPLVPSSPSYPLSLLLVSCLTITHSPPPMFPSHNIIDSLSLLVLLGPELSSSFLPVVVKSLQQIVSLIVSPLQSYYPLKIPRPCWPMASWSSKSIHFPDFVLLNLWVAFGIVDPTHSNFFSFFWLSFLEGVLLPGSYLWFPLIKWDFFLPTISRVCVTSSYLFL